VELSSLSNLKEIDLTSNRIEDWPILVRQMQNIVFDWQNIKTS